MIQLCLSSNVGFLLVFVFSELLVVCAVKTLYIGGLFQMTGSSLSSEASKAVLRVSQLAVNIINNRSDILPGYQLQLIWNDTKVLISIFIFDSSAETSSFSSVFKSAQIADFT